MAALCKCNCKDVLKEVKALQAKASALIVEANKLESAISNCCSDESKINECKSNNQVDRQPREETWVDVVKRGRGG